jgi:hypothetical protein
MEQPGRHERSAGPRDAKRRGPAAWRTGRPSHKPDPPETDSEDSPSSRRAEPDLIENWIRERSLYDLFDGRDHAPEDDPNS